MTTQAIQNPANILTLPGGVNGSAPSEAPDVPFNQVLQREVAERRGEQPPTAESRQSESAAGAAASASNAAAKKTDSDSAKEAKDATEDETATDDEADGPSAELLALVANMTQLASAAAGPADAKTSSKGDAALPVDALSGAGKRSDKSVDTLSDAAIAGRKQAADAAQEAALPAGALKAEASTSQRMSSLEGAQSVSQAGNTPALAATASPEVLAADLDAAIAPTAPQPLAAMQHGLNKLQPAGAPAAETLAPPVGTPAWDQAVGQKVVWMVAGAQQSASLTLNPPDLGPMQIVLNVSNAQANATFTAAQPEVRQALEAALPRLREMLGDAGIQLGQANINAGTPQQGGQFEQHGKPSPSHLAHDQHGDQPVTAARQQVIRRGLGMVDTFA